MKTEVLLPSPAVDFNFDSTCTSPFMTAPSSPQRLGSFFIFSAPTSPTRASAFFYNEFNNSRNGGGVDANSTFSSVIPFDWEEKPGTPKVNESKNGNEDDDDDFAFDFSGQFDRSSLPADELFDGGKIKPLKPPPRLQYSERSKVSKDSPRRSPRRIIKEALSPRHRKLEFDPFEAAIEQARNGNVQNRSNDHRGREKTQNSSKSGVRNKASRSLSPFRVSDIEFEQENNNKDTKDHSSTSSSSSSSVSSSFSKWYRKWKLKDILLFRSASEGRPRTGNEAINPKKYDVMNKSNYEWDDVKNSSFRSTDSVGSSKSSSRRRGLPVSAHEIHYTANRAVSDEMKKKTFLPYKRGLLGCLGFNPAIANVSRGINSLSRG